MADEKTFAQLIQDYRWAWDLFDWADSEHVDSANEALTRAEDALNGHIQERKQEWGLSVHAPYRRRDYAFSRNRVS